MRERDCLRKVTSHELEKKVSHNVMLPIIIIIILNLFTKIPLAVVAVRLQSAHQSSWDVTSVLLKIYFKLFLSVETLLKFTYFMGNPCRLKLCTQYLTLGRQPGKIMRPWGPV